MHASTNNFKIKVNSWRAKQMHNALQEITIPHIGPCAGTPSSIRFLWQINI